MRFSRYDNRLRKYHGFTVYGIKQSKQGFFWLNKCLEACVYSNFINQKQSSTFHH